MQSTLFTHNFREGIDRLLRVVDKEGSGLLLHHQIVNPPHIVWGATNVQLMFSNGTSFIHHLLLSDVQNGVHSRGQGIRTPLFAHQVEVVRVSLSAMRHNNDGTRPTTKFKTLQNLLNHKASILISLMQLANGVDEHCDGIDGRDVGAKILTTCRMDVEGKRCHLPIREEDVVNLPPLKSNLLIALLPQLPWGVELQIADWSVDVDWEPKEVLPCGITYATCHLEGSKRLTDLGFAEDV